jgi:hypothetical protein
VAVRPSRRISTENVLGSMRTLVDRSSEYDPDIWAAVHLVDGTATRGWCSAPGAPPPHRFVFALTRPADVARIAFDNACSDFEDAAARDVVVEVSTVGPQEGWREVLRASLAKGKNDQSFDVATPLAGKWLKLTILSNHGHPTLTELMEVRAYGLEAPEPRATDESQELAIDRLRVSKTKNGEAAAPATFEAGQTIWINWKPRGLRSDAHGECSFEADLVIESKDRKPLVARPKVVEHKGRLPRPPLSPFVALHVDLPAGFPPGEYDAHVTLRDRLSGSETSGRAAFVVGAK